MAKTAKEMVDGFVNPAKEKPTETPKEAPKTEPAVKVNKTGEIPTLNFENSGWCEKLQKSYRKGPYRPKNKEEFEALKPLAK